ncbi:glycerol kinase 5-like [Tachypleus tridentatus]|uniref:glycerol kinase 5-like n=2 Tax=Tachypleus tridentatus TaxID=6853 RepID=UPI003FD398CB
MSGDLLNGQKYIVAVDVGTTNVRCHIYDKQANIKGEAQGRMELMFPHHGWVELSPDMLWNTFVQVVRNGIKNAGIKAKQVACIGISTQRGTFTNWDRETGQPFHNLITWKDTRAERLCREWNNSIQMKCLRGGAQLLYFFTRRKRFLAASILYFQTGMVVMRLLWMLQHIPVIRERAVEGQAMFGTLDTWLMWKLTGGRTHATDSSCASISGMYDPFQMCWAGWCINMLNIPPSLLPVVKDTSGWFGKTTPEIFGASIPITAIIGDQQASTFGECCFDVGDVKCTIGTGAFININTGDKPHASLKGLYPVIGWKVGDSVTYLAEGSSYDAGTVLLWGQKIGLYDDVAQTSDLANSVPNSNGVCFVPAFSGLQAPVNDNLAVSGFIGISNGTTRAHMTRALLESLAFRIKQMYEVILEEANFQLNYLRVDGGVANNDFLVQLIADLTEQPVDRPKQRDMSCIGAAFLAGLAVGIWSSIEELEELRSEDQLFQPCDNWRDQYKDVVMNWERAVRRCLHWYKDEI